MAGATRSPSRRDVFAELAGLHGDKGVWRLLDRRAEDVVEVAVAGPIPRDVDTPGRLPGRPRRARPSHEPGAGPRRGGGGGRAARPRRRDARPAPGLGRLPGRRGPRHLDVPQPAPAAAAAARGRGRGGQDGGGAFAGGGARDAARAAAVLRGDRLRRGALRVELPAPAAQHPARRLPRRGPGRGGPVRARVPDPQAVAAGARAPGPAPGGPADRRDRPRRRRLRGVPARAARRVPR